MPSEDPGNGNEKEENDKPEIAKKHDEKDFANVMSEQGGKLRLFYQEQGKLNLSYEGAVATAAPLAPPTGPKSISSLTAQLSSIAATLAKAEEIVEEKLEDLLEAPPPPAAAPKVAPEEEHPPAPERKVEQLQEPAMREPAIVQAKREPALMQPEPPTGALALGRPVSEEDRNKDRAMPETFSVPGRFTSASRGDSGPSVTSAEGSRFPWPGGARRSPSNQTSAYQALSSSETSPSRLRANVGVSETSEQLNATIGGAGGKLFPSPTPLIMVGGQRKSLRENFNLKEIDVELLFRRYDADRSNQLEQTELRMLLTAFVGRPSGNIREDEYNFVMAVADKNRDECISKKELSYGLQAWYAFNFMPSEVNAALKKYQISPEGSPWPSALDLRSLLSDLNGFIDVDADEAGVVRHAALALGATQNRVSSEQLRRAIAVWYINIERSGTAPWRLAEHSLSRLTSSVLTHSQRLLKKVPKVFSDKPEDLERGIDMNRDQLSTGGSAAPLMREADLKDPAQEPDDLCCGFEYGPMMCFIVIWILPGLYMVHVGGWYPSPPTCEHDLAWLIAMKGYLCMISGFCGLIYQILFDGHFRVFVAVAGIISVVVFIIQNFVGALLVMHSDPEKCGGYLYNANELFFVWSIFWLPCFCCSSCACFLLINLRSSYVSALRMDRSLDVVRTDHR